VILSKTETLVQDLRGHNNKQAALRVSSVLPFVTNELLTRKQKKRWKKTEISVNKRSPGRSNWFAKFSVQRSKDYGECCAVRCIAKPTAAQYVGTGPQSSSVLCLFL